MPAVTGAQFLPHPASFLLLLLLLFCCVFLMCLCVSHSIISKSLLPHELQPVRLLCPCDSPGKNTGVGCYDLRQGIFLTQGSILGILHCRQSCYHLSHQGIPLICMGFNRTLVFLSSPNALSITQAAQILIHVLQRRETTLFCFPLTAKHFTAGSFQMWPPPYYWFKLAKAFALSSQLLRSMKREYRLPLLSESRVFYEAFHKLKWRKANKQLLQDTSC